MPGEYGDSIPMASPLQLTPTPLPYRTTLSGAPGSAAAERLVSFEQARRALPADTVAG